MASPRVEDEIRIMQQLPTYYDRMQYVRQIPVGIRARVVGEVLDRAKIRACHEKLQQQMQDFFRSEAEREYRPIDAFCPPSIW